MSEWNHDICDVCWDKKNAEEGTPGREAFRLFMFREALPCCFCGMMTESGIVVRHDPKTLTHCQGHTTDEN